MEARAGIFLIWGIIHGSALCIARAYNARGYAMPDLLSRLLTLVVVMLAWTVFRASDFSAALTMWGGQVRPAWRGDGRCRLTGIASDHVCLFHYWNRVYPVSIDEQNGMGNIRQ